MSVQAKQGPGAFQWNLGGWVGSQLGATVWLLILGGMMLAQSRPSGAAVLVFGLIPNLIGIALWRRRDAISPYPAIQILIAACGVSALLAMLCLAVVDDDLSSTGLPSIWFLLVYPGLMFSFHLQERAARNAQKS